MVTVFTEMRLKSLCSQDYSKSWITVYRYKVKLASQLLQSQPVSKEAFAKHASGKKNDPQIGSSVISCDTEQKITKRLLGIWAGEGK